MGGMDSDHIYSAIEQVLEEVAAAVHQTSGESLAQASALMEAAPRIFVAGAGRSGLCMRALGMRLMHLGKTVYVVSETTTPGITAEDVLILGSGSGKTPGLLAIGEQARCLGAKTILFTTDETAPLAVLADHLVVIPAPLIEDEMEGETGCTSVQPLGTLFEQSLLILCDSLILGLMRSNGVSAAQMFERHANLQ